MKRLTYVFLAIVIIVGMLAINGCNRPETYIVTFNANGGTGTMEQQVFTEGEQQALSIATFTRNGYSFVGWNGNGKTYTDGQHITITSDMTLYAQWAAYADLGLPSGTKWATCNVGANSPEEFGDYFAWGETTPRAQYDYDNYTYTEFSYYADIAQQPVLPPSADAATINWGADWRMPTLTEFEELKDECTTTWINNNGVTGIIFTGPNGNSILMPYTTTRDSSHIYPICSAWWTSNPYDKNGAFAFIAYRNVSIDIFSRFLGLNIRPVRANNN
jgi:uncharacterized repeat protein (TIGR02543 family)